LAYHPSSGVGYVRGGNSRFYFLEYTGVGEIKQIAKDEYKSYFVRPICFHLEPGYSCNFYEQSVRGHGPLIGQYEGPIESYFDMEYASHYECWLSGSEHPPQRMRRQRPNDRHRPSPLEGKPCGYIGVSPCLDNKFAVDHANSCSSLIHDLWIVSYGQFCF
jgi:hypothetical protein